MSFTPPFSINNNYDENIYLLDIVPIFVGFLAKCDWTIDPVVLVEERTGT